MLTSTTAMMLRVVPARTGSLQPILFRGTTTSCPYSTFTTASPLALRPKIIETLTAVKPQPRAPSTFRAQTLTIHRLPQQQQRRAASTTADPSPAGAASSSTASPAGQNGRPLDWNTFFQLRQVRRRWQLGFSVVLCLGGGTSGAWFLSTGSLDPLVSQLPLDPFIALGLITFGFAALGWLLGPSLGNTVFNVLKRRTRTQMLLKENQFFARIRKNRVDPSNASTSNPVPDFYGEKIQSVAGYRQWLKDQRAYKKKRTTFIK